MNFLGKIFIFLMLFNFCFAKEYKVEVLGDLEGQWERLSQFVEASSILSWEGNSLRLEENSKFVFLGDALDRGPHGMRILQTLIALKKKYPDQVVLIVGNRDLNKTDLTHPKNLLDDGTYSPEGIKKLFRKKNAKEAFEFRRTELSILHNRDVSDAEVTASLIHDVRDPKGLLIEYFQLGELIHFDQKTRSLFVHGGFPDEAAGAVPGMDKKFDSLLDFETNLNEWFHNQVRDMINGASGSDLRKYRRSAEGVISSRFSDATGNPKIIKGPSYNYMVSNEVQNIVVGHTPAGEIPGVVQDENITLILADVSYSKDTSFSHVSIEAEKVVLQGQLKGQLTKAVIYPGLNPFGRLYEGNRIVSTYSISGDYIGWKVDAEADYISEYTFYKASEVLSHFYQMTCKSLLDF